MSVVLHEYKYLVNTENYAYEAINQTYNRLGKGPFVSKKEFTIARDFVNTRVAEAEEPYFRLKKSNDQLMNVCLVRLRFGSTRVVVGSV